MKTVIGAWRVLYIPTTWLQYDRTLFVTYLTKDIERAVVYEHSLQISERQVHSRRSRSSYHYTTIPHLEKVHSSPILL